MALKMWHDGVDWVIAPSSEEAERLRTEHYGEKATGLHPWAEWEKPTLRVTPDEGATWETKPIAEWIAENGPGFLASTEW